MQMCNLPIHANRVKSYSYDNRNSIQSNQMKLIGYTTKSLYTQCLTLYGKVFILSPAQRGTS
ncbi:hypothetical protein VCRA2133E348_40056 [Vibrio crassostreae]|nr:hypothetical protein VCRA2133E348_40056 [Vibrio crassostreae]CAK3241944.1 hypothetical protein VCRA213O314_10135 [Vibrio crassostreae]